MMTGPSIRRFYYRRPRFATNLRMELMVGAAIFPGVCESINEAGLYGQIGENIPNGINGIVTLYHQGTSCKVQVCLSFMEGRRAGLNFLFSSDQERADIRAFLAMIGMKPSG